MKRMHYAGPPSRLTRSWIPALSGVFIAVFAGLHSAVAGDTAAPARGDTAWIMTSTALVLAMAIPGLALFYGGLVRSKNMLSVLTQVFVVVCAPLNPQG